MAFVFEEAEFAKLRGHAAVITGDLRDLEVSDVVAGEEVVEVVPRGSGVERDERVGYVLADEVEDHRVASGVGFDPIGDVVDFALDRDP